MRKLIGIIFVAALVIIQSGYAETAGITLKKGDRIVFLGDSITAFSQGADGYVMLVKNAINHAHPDYGVETINAGVGGNKVADLQARLQKDVLDKKPSIVFIYIGINDVWHWAKKDKNGQKREGTTKEAFDAGLRDIIGKIKASGAQVALCTPTVICEFKPGTGPQDQMLDEFSDVGRKIATDMQVPLVDLRKAFADYLAVNNPKNAGKGILTADRVHLNSAGYKLVAEQMVKVLGIKLEEKPATGAAK